MTNRPLGVVKNILENDGMEISFAYEDLIFLEHNGFLLQFTDIDNVIHVHTNKEADEAVINRDLSRLLTSAHNHDMSFLKGKVYTLSQGAEKSIRLEFDEVI
ncbi:MAG: hypothetical protein RI601_06990 [Desulfurivibrionaceae bacterium]|nr:hypothetical protein [Desulfurivibrionaceae bacterium]